VGQCRKIESWREIATPSGASHDPLWRATSPGVAGIKAPRSVGDWPEMRQSTLLLLFACALSCCAPAQVSSQTLEAKTQAAAPVSNTPGQSGTAVENEADPLLDLPPLPNTQVTLVGGKVTGIDRVRDKVTVQAFGGKKMKIAFDERTHIYRDGVETTQLGIRKGDRVYVDTQLVGSSVFARNIRVENKSAPADAQGQIVSYDASRGTMVLRDSLSSEPVTFRVAPSTVVSGKANSVGELREGALVKVKFAPDSAKSGVAEEITVTARPGETFTFAGRVTYLDMRSGTLAVLNQSDHKSYEIHFDPMRGNLDTLSVGSEVAINAVFDGKQYSASNLEVKPAKTAEK
jgi:hypothetical protein